MTDWSLIAKGTLEDAAGLAEDLGHLFRKHGASAVALSTDQFQGDPRDIPALDADPNAPVEATPAVAEPEDDGPATDETRDDLPVTVVSDGTETAGNVDITSPDGLSTSTAARPPVTLDPHDPGPVPDGA